MSIKETTEQVVLEIMAQGYSPTLESFRKKYYESNAIADDPQATIEELQVAQQSSEDFWSIRECLETIQSDKFTTEQKNEAVEWIGW